MALGSDQMIRQPCWGHKWGPGYRIAGCLGVSALDLGLVLFCLAFAGGRTVKASLQTDLEITRGQERSHMGTLLQPYPGMAATRYSVCSPLLEGR